MKRVMTGDFLSGLNISEVWAKSQSVAAPPETRAYSLLIYVCCTPQSGICTQASRFITPVATQGFDQLFVYAMAARILFYLFA